MKFFLSMCPPTVTAQERKVTVRNGRPIFYEPQGLKAARQIIMKALVPYKPEEPLPGPIELKVIWLFPTRKNSLDGAYRETRPDTDNLDKLLKDCMTKSGFWHDDAQVCKEVIEKRWVKSSPSGIKIEVTQL